MSRKPAGKVVAVEVPKGSLETLPIDDIKPNPLNPRRVEDYQIDDLRRNLYRAVGYPDADTANGQPAGIHTPLLVNRRNNGDYVLVRGHRRREAALANRDGLPFFDKSGKQTPAPEIGEMSAKYAMLPCLVISVSEETEFELLHDHDQEQPLTGRSRHEQIMTCLRRGMTDAKIAAMLGHNGTTAIQIARKLNDLGPKYVEDRFSDSPSIKWTDKAIRELSDAKKSKKLMDTWSAFVEAKDVGRVTKPDLRDVTVYRSAMLRRILDWTQGRCQPDMASIDDDMVRAFDDEVFGEEQSEE